MTELVERVPAALLRSLNVASVELVGSRSGGTHGPLSDWDFAVGVDDFGAVADALPALVVPLDPLAQQWDPLGHHRCYMLMLRGAVKVDLIFDEPQDEQSPWVASAESLPAIDRHFWDWILWLAGKDQAGKADVVAGELEKLSWFLLRPVGADERPHTIARAIEVYRDASRDRARALGVDLPRVLEREVVGRLRAAGYAV